jgi:choline-sulfatase
MTEREDQSLDRREFLGASLAGLLALGASKKRPLSGSRPNVLFVSVDDMNRWIYGDPRLGGYEGMRAPHVDELRRRGLTFAEAHCTSPMCLPSRTDCLTGRRSFHTPGQRRKGAHWKPRNETAETLPALFRRNGYRVVGGGKVFHRAPGDSYSPPLKETDWEASVWHEYWPVESRPAPVKGRALWGPYPPSVKKEDLPDWRLAGRAADFLRAKPSEPFFLAVGLASPHNPFLAPPDYFDRYPLSGIRLPSPAEAFDFTDLPGPVRRRWLGENELSRRRFENWPRVIQSYLALLSFTDDCLGRIFSALEQSGLSRNTYVVLWSDHGQFLGEKSSWKKFRLWQESTAVPLVVSGPEIARGETCSDVVSLLDIYPTLASLCRLTPSWAPAGRDLGSLLRKRAKGAAAGQALTYWEQAGLRGVSLRTPKWRYTKYSKGSSELYDAEADPKERYNLLPLSGAPPPLYQALIAELDPLLEKEGLGDWLRGGTLS